MAEIVELGLTDGVPLFVEELTKAVLEARSERGGRGPAHGRGSGSLAGPRRFPRLCTPR